jgi:hypothetical protein
MVIWCQKCSEGALGPYKELNEEAAEQIRVFWKFKKRDDVGIHGYTLNDTSVVDSGRSS